MVKLTINFLHSECILMDKITLDLCLIIHFQYWLNHAYTQLRLALCYFDGRIYRPSPLEKTRAYSRLLKCVVALPNPRISPLGISTPSERTCSAPCAFTLSQMRSNNRRDESSRLKAGLPVFATVTARMKHFVVNASQALIWRTIASRSSE